MRDHLAWPPKHSKALATAGVDDWKRGVVDAAKKRAVAQGVDYDTFKNMVLVAHLQPIGAESKKAGDCTAPAAMLCKDGKAIATPGAATHNGDGLPPVSSQSTLPQSAGRFEQCWRLAHSPHERFSLLCRYQPQQLTHMFRLEIKTTMLSEIIACMCAVWASCASAEEASPALPQAKDPGASSSGTADGGLGSLSFQMLALLDGLSHAGRFDLAIKCLSKSLHSHLHDMLGGMRNAQPPGDQAHELADLIEETVERYTIRNLA